MLVHVTQAHIDKGTHGCLDCPVALALQELTGKVWSIDGLSANLWEENKHLPLPKTAADFIYNFDNNLSVKPFSFVL